MWVYVKRNNNVNIKRENKINHTWKLINQDVKGEKEKPHYVFLFRYCY